MDKDNKITCGELEVTAFTDGVVEIESRRFRNLGIELRLIDPTVDIFAPPNAIYKLKLYIPESNHKLHPSEYGLAYVTSDGKIISK